MIERQIRSIIIVLVGINYFVFTAVTNTARGYRRLTVSTDFYKGFTRVIIDDSA